MDPAKLPKEVIITAKFRVREALAQEIKGQIEDFAKDFLEDSVEVESIEVSSIE